ncbi:MAG TPA: MFS transporter [Candidatus Limnocylindrales bacterium]|nr:MFS transporter [Candidatus Limnocylindrales bacterium]
MTAGDRSERASRVATGPPDVRTPGPDGRAGVARPRPATSGELARRSEPIPRESLLLGVSIFLLICATNVLTPLLPEIRTDFGVSIATAGLIVGSYGLARLAVDLPAGFLADRVGHRRLSVLALGLLLVSSAVGFASPSVGLLIAARVGSGIAVGILATVIIAALSATAGPGNRGKVMSLFHVANNTGIALYPLVGGIVGALVGWRATFVVTALLALVAAAILVPLLLRLDLPRAGESRSGGADESRVLHGRARAVAIAVTNFGVVANMVHRHGFRNTILPLYAATSLGLGGISIATAIALMSITGLLVATPGGMLGDRIGRRRVIASGLAAVAVGDLVFLLTGDLVTFLLAAALIGFGDFFTSSQTALLSEIVPPGLRTRVLSGYRFSADLGALLGPVVLAAVMDVANAQAAIVLAAAILFSAALAARLGVPATADRPAGGPAS